MAKRLIIEPMGGLCNRMRAVASAYTLARSLDYQVVILWEKNSDCNCGFHSLFKITPPARM